MNKYYWTFNKNDETWANGADSISECLTDAKTENAQLGEDNQLVYIGLVNEHVPTICAEDILERLTSEAYDACGDLGEDYLNVVKKEDLKDLSLKLNEVLKEWLVATGNEPTFGTFDTMWCYDLASGKVVLT